MEYKQIINTVVTYVQSQILKVQGAVFHSWQTLAEQTFNNKLAKKISIQSTYWKAKKYTQCSYLQ